MKRETVSQQIDAVKQQMEALSQQVGVDLNQQSHLLTEALEELGTTIEELQASQEALHQQNLELAEAQQAIETERQRYQELFEFAPDGYLLTDPQGKIWQANQAASQLLNVKQKHLLGKPLSVFVPKEDRRAFRRGVAQLQEGGRLQDWGVRLQARGGSEFDAALTATTVYDWEGNSIALRWLMRDISDRKRLEEAQLRTRVAEATTQNLQQEILQRQQLEAALRQQTEALMQANSMKDDFLAIVSHELRSPLNAMLGWAQLLRSRQMDEETRERALETIERNARLQAQLVEDLLDVSRIIRGSLHLNVRPVNLAGVIRAAIDAVHLAATAKQIEIHAALDETTGWVSGDSDRLHQVIWNLLSNAIKFTPKQGRVTVQLQQVDSSARLTVSDTGQGIAAEFLPYVFDRFRQAERATTRYQGGLGLGLAIVRQLVEMHGGTVQAASPGVGQGATFTVQLPSLAVQTPPGGEAAGLEGAIADQQPLNRVRVLVVDDEADARELVAFVLGQAGAIVTVAASAAQALEYLIQGSIDVLLSDVGMPEQDGYSLLAQIRAAESLKHIPAIALTAYARAEDQERAAAVGFQCHLRKPVDPLKLIATVARVCQQSSFGAEAEA